MEDKVDPARADARGACLEAAHVGGSLRPAISAFELRAPRQTGAVADAVRLRTMAPSMPPSMARPCLVLECVLALEWVFFLECILFRECVLFLECVALPE